MADEPTTDDTGTDDDQDGSTDPALGDAGKAALAAERAARKDAQKAAKTAQAELEALRKSSQTDQDRALAEAKAQIRAEVFAESNARLLRTEIRAAASGKLADPGDAAALLGDLDRFVGKDGEPDVKAIASAIDALVKTKPYLAAAGTRPGPLPGGGAKPSNGFSINDDIRARAGRSV